MSVSARPRILVIGAGGIGGIVAGGLTEVGADVTAVTTNPSILAAVTTSGFVLRDGGDVRAIPGRIVSNIPAGEQFDAVVLATQPPGVEAAARSALGVMRDDSVFVVLQNGLCESRIAAIAGAQRVVGGIVAWGAAMPEPGIYDRTASGGFTLGRIAGDADDACRMVGGLFEAVGPVTYTANLMGARWSKLALNAAISSLGTIGGDRLGALVGSRRVRRLALDIMTEAVAVAQAEAVTLEKVSGTLDLNWVALTPSERASRLGSPALTAKHGLLLAVGLRYRRMRSSMLSAIERGRPPAIDFLNGEIVAHAARHGIATPVNQRVVDVVWSIARGDLASSHGLLDQLYAETRVS